MEPSAIGVSYWFVNIEILLVEELQQRTGSGVCQQLPSHAFHALAAEVLKSRSRPRRPKTLCPAEKWVVPHHRRQWLACRRETWSDGAMWWDRWGGRCGGNPTAWDVWQNLVENRIARETTVMGFVAFTCNYTMYTVSRPIIYIYIYIQYYILIICILCGSLVFPVTLAKTSAGFSNDTHINAWKQPWRDWPLVHGTHSIKTYPKTAKQSCQDLERGWVCVLLEAHNGVIFHDLGYNMDNHQFQHFVSSLLEYW